MAACGAKTRSGGKCRRPGMQNGRCRLHGGLTPIGPAHHAYRTGRHSKWLPKEAAKAYEASVKDPNLLSLRGEVAVVDMRVGELLAAIGQTGNLRLWRQMAEQLEAFKAAGTKRGALGQARIALAALEATVQAGLTSAATWDELRETLDLRRRLAESETKRQKDLRQMITLEQALALIGIIVEEIEKRVADREAVAAIVNVCLRLTGRGDGAAPPQG